MEKHTIFMQAAIQAAKNNLTAPFGAVLVDRASEEIAAVGYNQGQRNLIWHGEIVAINHFAEQDIGTDWRNLRLYTTAEPCPMCQSAILWSGISSVVFGTSIRTLQQLGWNQIDIDSSEVCSRAEFAECEVIGGILEAECDALFRNAIR